MAGSLLRLLSLSLAVLLQLRYALPLHLYVLTPPLHMTQPTVGGRIHLLPLQPAAAAGELQFRGAQGKDFVRDVQQLLHSFYHLVHTAGTTTKRPKRPPHPYYKPFLDRLAFGNLSLSLAFTFNFENTNTFG